MFEVPLLLAVIVLVALVFDFTNGAHDCANAIATVVSTKVVTPRFAVGAAALLNLGGALLGTEVAKTLGSGIVLPHVVEGSHVLVLAALVGAIAWNCITWYYGIPSSSSHALIGGLIGAAVADEGFGALNVSGIVDKVLIPLVGSPLAGYIAGFLIMWLIYWIFGHVHRSKVNWTFRHLQLVSAGFMATSHGLNDAQKTMGIVTLALVIFGDLDVSVIDELPPGRQKVDTFALGESYRPRVQAFIRKLAAAGQQIFIVCPLVGEADQIPDERKAVTAYAKQLREQVFPDLRVAVLHGKMKPREKEKLMAAFAAGESDILVSTTVVEVGVDVPNATCMVVENADRFGLSQLHQLRGRVGRGKAKSYCILLSDSQNEETRARLKVMTQTNDGFRISQEDLRLRGPGDFFGQRQHGLPTLKIADLACDMQLLEEAQSAARALLCRDEDLSRPEHRPLLERVRELFHDTADSMN